MVADANIFAVKVASVNAVDTKSALVNKVKDLSLDVLEPVAGASLANGTLTVTGSSTNDNLSIYAEQGNLIVREAVKNQTWLTVPLASVSRIVVVAHAGDDYVNVDAKSINFPVTMYGGSGNDTLLGGNSGDYLYGDTGNDEIHGRGGNDAIYGGDGDDLLSGGDGNDVIYGANGNDYLLGGNGNDWLIGEAGNDQLFGEAGNDMLFGGDGDNLISGGDGIDNLYGGAGIDAMYGGEGDDYLRAFAGDDRLRGEGGNDIIDAEAGNDAIEGGLGNDTIAGGLGNDVISGDEGNDLLYGGDGQDWIDGGDGNDTLDGGAGNDWMQGRGGVDVLTGGTGTNQAYQDRASGYVEYSTTTQSIGLSDFTDFVGDVWDGIVGAFNWTVDKAISIGTRFYDWAANFDDRVFRLGSDLAGALSNWPWKEEFWRGLGRSLVDVLEIGGLTEAWEIASEVLKPWQRGMTSTEIAVARQVFGDSIPYDRVRFDEHSLMAAIGRTHTTGFIVNSTENVDDRVMIHELTHVWQYVKSGLVYLPQAIEGQNSDAGYDFGGVAGLAAVKAAGGHLNAFNVEQQGSIVDHYFELRQQARGYEAIGMIAPTQMRQDLDTYIYFVKEVSTLTATQLDTPDSFTKVKVKDRLVLTNPIVVATPRSSKSPAPALASPLVARNVDALMVKVTS